MSRLFACLFPGQGSQTQGMGRDLAEYWPDAMELWKLAEKEAKTPLREIFWDGDADSMSQTRYLQPALTVVNMTFWLFGKNHLRPTCVAGHSLGEFCALFAAEVLDHKEILQTVVLRGRLMAEAGQQAPGAMLAVLKLTQEQVENIVKEVQELCPRELRVANYNTPAQYVLSGQKDAIDLAADKIKEARGRSIPLAVSGAFHSPLMREAAKELNAFLDKLDWKTPSIPVVLNVNAQAEKNPATIKDCMGRQMTSSVLWEQSVKTMHEMGVTEYIELGPKAILGKMVKTILPEHNPNCISLCNLTQLTEWKKDNNA